MRGELKKEKGIKGGKKRGLTSMMKE